jgi:hypothetical protein
LERPVAVQVKGITSTVAVRLASNHACALLNDGTVRCWGKNRSGVLGNGTTFDSHVPVVVKGVSNAVAVSASHNASCALMRDGTVMCWGNNHWGYLGNGTTVDSSTAVSVGGISTATSIGAAKDNTCAVLANGAVRCWGGYTLRNKISLEFLTEPVDIGGHTNATAVAMGGNRCVLLKTGQVQCTGDNYAGQLGNGTTQPNDSPVTVLGISNATEVAVGLSSGCARLSDGTVKCWGNNKYGQLGNGAPLMNGEVTDWELVASHVPVSVKGLSNVAAITSGSDYYCALLNSGTVQCWGGNGCGQFGNGTATSSSIPVPAVLSLPKPSNCKGAWLGIWPLSMPESEIRAWFEGHRLALPDALPTCVRALPAPGGSALLCRRTAIIDDRYAEVFVEVIGVQSGQLKRWLSIPVAAGGASDVSCDVKAKNTKPVAKVEVVASSDGRAVIVRDTEGTSCVERARMEGSALTDTEQVTLANQICATRGVYDWTTGALLKNKSAIVSTIPTKLPLDHGYLQGPCVDPQAHARTHYAESRRDDRFLGIDIDLDGDGTLDPVLYGGASVWQATYLLYVQRDDCAYFVGSVEASENPRALPERHHGLFDIHTADEGCRQSNTKEITYCDTVWRFDGRRYRRFRDTPTTQTPGNIRP